MSKIENLSAICLKGTSSCTLWSLVPFAFWFFSIGVVGPLQLRCRNGILIRILENNPNIVRITYIDIFHNVHVGVIVSVGFSWRVKRWWELRYQTRSAFKTVRLAVRRVQRANRIARLARRGRAQWTNRIARLAGGRKWQISRIAGLTGRGRNWRAGSVARFTRSRRLLQSLRPVIKGSGVKQ